MARIVVIDFRDVIESDQFFSSRRRSDHDAEILPLTEKEIELERRNIRGGDRCT